MSHTLTQPWFIAVVVIVVLATGAVGWWARRPQPDAKEVTWLANASYVPRLSAFRRQLRVYKVGMAAAAVLLLGASVAAGVIAARPVEETSHSEELAARDIVLCLDVSGSMIGYDEEIVDRFLELVPSFDGERVALSIWNSTSRTVFPLTDDYDMVTEQLEEARYVLSFDLDSFGAGMDMNKYDRLLEFVEGTHLESLDSASLVGDGLASCGLLFNDDDADRSQSIIFATDNDVQGDPLYSLPEAAEKISERDIDLFGLYAGESTDTSPELRDEYRDVFESHDGLFYEASDPELADDVVDRIADQQADELDASEEITQADDAQNALGWLTVAVGGYLIVMWRLRS